MLQKKGLWIAVTGLDGSGKTTLIDNLQIWFEERGLKVYRSRLPHDEYLVKTLLNQSNDPYTDRMLFALDNRIFGTKLREIREDYDIILTQRCFLDSFVHGAVQGFSYSFIGEMNRISDLPKTDIMIHLVAEASEAYKRICDDPDADKFEYPDYIEKQEIETRRAYAAVIKGSDPALSSFRESKNIYIDTTQMTTIEVFDTARNRLISYLL